MKKSQLIEIIKEEVNKMIQEATQEKLQGSNINIELFKKLAPNVNPQFIASTISLVKQNKALNNAANKILADLMVAMIQTSDDALLTKIFQNLKQMEVK